MILVTIGILVFLSAFRLVGEIIWEGNVSWACVRNLALCLGLLAFAITVF